MKSVQQRAGGWMVAVSAAVLAACGGGGGGDATASGTGTLRVALTDAPSCGYDEVNVTIQKVRVHRSANAGQDDAGWSDLPLAAPRRVNLLDLQNGLLEELGQMPLEAGRYQQMRLVLGDNAAGNTEALPNSVKPTGSTERGLETPSAQQSGLKLNVDLEVKPDQMLDLVLDFDACKSVVRAGNAGRYSLKPVVSVIPRYVSGVRGTVASGWPAGTTQVSLQQGAGTVVKATTPDATGSFMLQPVAPGTYTVVVAAPGQATAVVTGVVVTADSVTTLGTSGTAAFPAFGSAAGSGTAAGRVTTGTTPVDASTRVLQALTGGPTIELAALPVDSTTGDYSHVLPVEAPRVAPYASGASLTFGADTAAAATYSVQAIGTAGSKTVGPFKLGANATTTNHITLP